MNKLLKRVVLSQKGQALPVVLALMLLGGLVIPPALDYAATGLNSTRIIGKGVNGLYAAEAGIENTIWSVKHSVSPPQQLPGTINGMQVSIQTENKGTYTVYFGELVPATEHNDWLNISGEIVPEGDRYRYTITATWQPVPGTPLIHLSEVGVRLPDDFTYDAGSALIPGNLSESEPEQTQDSLGAYMLKWRFGSPYPSLSESDPVRTQIFYVSGDINPEGEYAWAVAVRSDVGIVGEIVGSLYRIKSTATNPQDGKVTGEVVAEILEAERTYILTWRISK